MGVRKLYGSLDSPDTMRALASLNEHKLDFDFIPIDLKSGEHKREPFLSMSPFGDVPAYQDEQLTLFESRTVMRFISHCYFTSDNEQVYEDPRLQGIAAEWIDIEDHQFDPPASKLTWELVLKPKLIGQPPDPTVVAQEQLKLAKVLDIYEKRLAESNFLGGHKYTSADLTHLPGLYYLTGTPVDQLFEERPLVSAWKKSIMSRPGWKKVVAVIEGVQA
uniref:glutathione transferase n=1 Tax=Kalanchoe fedtschenkoi TaxID=63787 RepID=A0A7N0V398_KALFE